MTVVPQAASISEEEMSFFNALKEMLFPSIARENRAGRKAARAVDPNIVAEFDDRFGVLEGRLAKVERKLGIQEEESRGGT